MELYEYEQIAYLTWVNKAMKGMDQEAISVCITRQMGTKRTLKSYVPKA